MSFHGWLLIDKPEGISSFSVVSLVRRLLGIKKVGHAGTLDPLASGVLALALGEATKTVPFIMNHDKTYEFWIRWGSQTTTDDAEGEILYSSSQYPNLQDVQAYLPHFIGSIEQVPPAFSAIKIQGQRAYAKARAGEEVELSARPTTVYDLQWIERLDACTDRLRVTCSKGTYVRSLARDLGKTLGCYGHAMHIRRIKSGNFSIEQTISLERLSELRHKNELQSYIISIPDVLDDIPAVRLGLIQEQRLRCGQSIDGVCLQEPSAHHVVLCLAETNLPIGLCYIQDQTLKPFRLFNI